LKPLASEILRSAVRGAVMRLAFGIYDKHNRFRDGCRWSWNFFK